MGFHMSLYKDIVNSNFANFKIQFYNYLTNYNYTFVPLNLFNLIKF